VNELRADLLEARDGRQRSLQRALGSSTVLMISANLPGADKHRPGTARLLRAALDGLDRAIGLELLESRGDRLGPFHLAASAAAPGAAKAAALALEAESPSGRLLDLDVYGPDGVQLDRAGMGLAERPCLVCAGPARECIRLGRHDPAELDQRVAALLRPWQPPTPPLAPDTLAAQLTLGARRELELTPKPGLVDRRDNGSHPDLSLQAMAASVGLLPRYFDAILDCCRQGRPLSACVQAGIQAEARMTRAIQSNAHKGFIFLGGLLLMAAHRCGGRPEPLPEAVAELARACFASTPPDPRGLGGVRAEALAGLPAVFRHGWPRYREALDAGWPADRAGFLLMAVLMQRVEDSTSVRRCGLEGLTRLRQDGAGLQRLLERGLDPEPWLAERNREYRACRFTMGGVADCMALVFALEATAAAG
jgi:triphosphoribosyl-dephospho-CoA synthase